MQDVPIGKTSRRPLVVLSSCSHSGADASSRSTGRRLRYAERPRGTRGIVAAGKVIVRHCPLERFDGRGGPFDKIYAINVNLFWVRDAKDQLRRITTFLKPGGALYLFVEAPAPEKGNEIARRLRAVLADAGLEPEETNIGAFPAFIARRRVDQICTPDASTPGIRPTGSSPDSAGRQSVAKSGRRTSQIDGVPGLHRP